MNPITFLFSLTHTCALIVISPEALKTTVLSPIAFSLIGDQSLDLNLTASAVFAKSDGQLCDLGGFNVSGKIAITLQISNTEHAFDMIAQEGTARCLESAGALAVVLLASDLTEPG